MREPTAAYPTISRLFFSAPRAARVPDRLLSRLPSLVKAPRNQDRREKIQEGLLEGVAFHVAAAKYAAVVRKARKIRSVLTGLLCLEKGQCITVGNDRCRDGDDEQQRVDRRQSKQAAELRILSLGDQLSTSESQDVCQSDDPSQAILREGSLQGTDLVHGAQAQSRPCRVDPRIRTKANIPTQPLGAILGQKIERLLRITSDPHGCRHLG